MPNPSPHPPSLLTQLIDLMLIQLSNWRWSWRRMLISGMLAPLVGLLALGLFARDTGTEGLVYVLTGSVVMGLMLENVGKVASNFAFMKEAGTLSYFATLPIRRIMVVVATVLAFFLLSLPSMIITVGLGAWFLGIALRPSVLLFVVVPLTGISLATLGALIGSRARSIEEAGSISTALVFGLVVLGAVVIPPDRLPPLVRTAGWFSPATYAASALRQTLVGPLTPRLWLDVGVLTALSLLLGWLVAKGMDWRQG